MNTTQMIAVAVLIVCVVLYVARRRARLRREDLE